MIGSLELERQCIAASLKFPNVLADASFYVKEDDFEPRSPNKIIYSAILDATKKGEEVSSFTISEKLKNAGIALPQMDTDCYEYLEEIRLINLNENGASQCFKDLKKVSIRRELWQLGKTLQEFQTKNGNDTIDEIIEGSDKIYASKLSVFEQFSNVMFEDVFGDLEDAIEERGNNPIEDFGVKGPFERMNSVYGSVLRRGNINLVAARQGQGKTQLGQFFMMNVVQNYDIPVLHLDMGEMSRFEIQIRATSLLTGGLVSPDMLETGEWRKNPETLLLVRSVWPKVKEMVSKYYYKDVSECSPEQIISVAQRFYLTHVKPRNKKLEDGLEFILFYDYLKSFEATSSGQSKYHQEYQVMGYFMQKIKRAIQKMLPAALWASLQTNRIGITGNKSADTIDDTENIFGMSDRIIQQATHGWLLRRMTTEELVLEAGMGNYKFIPRKARHLGKERDAHLIPVRMPDGTLRDNYLYLEGKNFTWREVGDLHTMKDKYGASLTPPKEEDENEPNSHL